MWEYLYGLGVTPEQCWLGIKLCTALLALCVAIVLTVGGKEG